MIFDVLDEGGSVAEGRRFSVTNSELGFHTDNSFERAVPRYVMMYCLRVALHGGVTQLVSGHSVLDRLSHSFPNVVDRLKAPFWFDRRGGIALGERQCASYPVVAFDPRGPMIRYLRYYIEAGYAKANETIDPETRHALDVFDRLCVESESRANFLLAEQEVLVVNNHSTLHARTTFRDGAGVKRHMIRVWLQPETNPSPNTPA
ncbi:MAG: hypothetical protein QOH12_230 [Solirubrobacteraceae bacterium]|nr:hypothetical protein [Solirubrobacteraceae bacterium]